MLNLNGQIVGGFVLKKLNWKKTIIVVFTVLLIFIIFVIIKEAADNKKAKTTQYGFPKTACQMLTTYNARIVMGQTARRTGKAISNRTSAGLLETDCPYSNGTVSGNLNVKSPQNEESYKNLDSDFMTTYNEVSKYDRVKAYGGKGFWDAKTGKLYIFNKNTLFTITYGSSDPSARNLPQTEELADVFAPYLN